MNARPLPAAVIAYLHGALPRERVLLDPADCIVYGYDNSKRVALPQAVVFALTPEEVVSVVQLCNEFSLPLVVRGREIGRAACRERVCQYVEISGVAVTLKKKEKVTCRRFSI